MRKIKFRAFDQINKRMFFPSEDYQPQFRNGRVYFFENILMQYTGRKDKNGKEIYEGDICKWQTYINDNDIDEQIIEDIKFQKGSFTFHDFSLIESMPEAIEGSTFEIIGNIYENPELTKGDK